ncbi:hypothetical protein [Streptomyces tauricus]
MPEYLNDTPESPNTARRRAGLPPYPTDTAATEATQTDTFPGRLAALHKQILRNLVEGVEEIKDHALRAARTGQSDLVLSTDDEITEEQTETCTATLLGALIAGSLHRCSAPAGHYDETREPTNQRGERETGGWHYTTPSETGDQVVWSDQADGATPHETRCVGCGHTDGEGCGCPQPPFTTLEVREDETPAVLRELTDVVRELVAVMREDLDSRTEDAEATDLNRALRLKLEKTERVLQQKGSVLNEVLAAFVHKVHGYLIPRRSAEVDVVTLDKWRRLAELADEDPRWKQVDDLRTEVATARGELEQSQAAVTRVREYLQLQLEYGSFSVDPADVWNLLNRPQPTTDEPTDDAPDVVHSEANPQASGSPGVDDPWKTKAEEAEQRAEQLEELLQVANETSNESEAGRDRIRQEYEKLLTRWRNAQITVDRVRALAVEIMQATKAGTSDHDIGRYDTALVVLDLLKETETPAQQADQIRAYIDTALFEGYWKHLDQHIHRLRTDLAEWTPVGVLGSIEGMDDSEEDPAVPAFVWPHLHGKTALTARLGTSFTYTHGPFDEALAALDAIYRARLDRRLARLARALGQWEEIVRRDFHAVQQVLEDAGVLDGYGRITIPQPVRPPVIWEAP